VQNDEKGSLVIKQTKSKGRTYKYYYIEHHIGDKIKWCYGGKCESLPVPYKRLIDQDTQVDTQKPSLSEKLNLRLKMRIN